MIDDTSVGLGACEMTLNGQYPGNVPPPTFKSDMVCVKLIEITE